MTTVQYKVVTFGYKERPVDLQPYLDSMGQEGWVLAHYYESRGIDIPSCWEWFLFWRRVE